MRLNFTPSQTEEQEKKLYKRFLTAGLKVETVDILKEHIIFNVSTGKRFKSRKMEQNLMDYLRLQKGNEKEFIETIHQIFMSL